MPSASKVLASTLVISISEQLSVAVAIVLVVVWSEHRAMGFDACRFIINDLKHRAPFWKKEANEEGDRWVEGNTVDETADVHSAEVAESKK